MEWFNIFILNKNTSASFSKNEINNTNISKLSISNVTKIKGSPFKNTNAYDYYKQKRANLKKKYINNKMKKKNIIKKKIKTWEKK